MRISVLLSVATIALVACSKDSTGSSGEVTSVLVTPASDTLHPGQFVTLQVTSRDAVGSTVNGQVVSWISSDSATAIVSGLGVVTAENVGDATIIATVGQVHGQAHIHVSLTPAGHITIAPHLDSLAPGQSVAFSAVVTDSSGNTVLLGRTITWSSSNSGLVSVTVGGVATVHDTGSARVRATVEGVSDSAAVIGSDLVPAAIALTPLGDTLGVGDTVTVSATMTTAVGDTVHPVVSYGSDNTGVVMVSTGGLVSATGTGAATITATAGGASSSVQILVASCAAQPSFNPNSWVFLLGAGGFRSPSGVVDEVLFKTTGVGFATAPMYGTDSSHFVMGYNPGSGATDLAGTKVCTLTASPLHTYAQLRTAATPVPGLVVREEVLASNAAGATDYVLFRYTFTNTGTASITGFSAGMLVDWDLNWDNNATDDNVRWNSALGMQEAVESDTVTHAQVMGLVPVAASGGVTAHAWTNGQDPVRGGLFQFLTVKDTTLVGPNDIRGMMGRGPVTIPPGGKYVVLFALVGGSSRSAFNASVAAAQSAAGTLDER